MTLSIKSIGGTINDSPKVRNLKVTSFEQKSIDIEYKVEDTELSICRHYLLLNGSKTEITKDVGYESENNIFKYKITGLNYSTTYTIQIVASDGLDEGLSEAIQQVTKKAIEYGVRVDESNSNPETSVTYIEDAIGISPATNTSYGGWADKWPFKDIRIVGFENGKVTKEINPNNKRYYTDGTVVPGNVDVMSEFPKVYWKFTKVKNGYELRISDIKLDSEYECLAHTVGNIEKDVIYIGSYLGNIENGNLRSKSGVKATINKNVKAFRNRSKARGAGYCTNNYYSHKLLQILYLIAYKNLNSQEVLGVGYSDKYEGTNTGGSDTKGFIYGSQNRSEQICLFGVEDAWGNMREFIDGLTTDENGNILAISNNTDFEDYQKYEIIDKFNGEYISGFANIVNCTNKGGFLIKSPNGSATTHYCDLSQLYSGSLGYRVLGTFNWRHGHELIGIFGLGLSIVSEVELLENTCVRLCYLGR